MDSLRLLRREALAGRLLAARTVDRSRCIIRRSVQLAEFDLLHATWGLNGEPLAGVTSESSENIDERQPLNPFSNDPQSE
jgi:hypothetical protein